MRVREPFGAPFVFIGGAMVARWELEAISMRHDTLVARAFRIALDLPARICAAPKASIERRLVRDRRFDGMGECMRNRRSPMDGR